MTAVILDAGALIAVERDDRRTLSRLEVARRRGEPLRTNAMVVAQVWRGGRDRQSSLAALLHGVDVLPVTDELGRAAGSLLGRAGAGDPIDATVVLTAADGDRIVTSDPDDLHHLAAAAGVRVGIVRC